MKKIIFLIVLVIVVGIVFYVFKGENVEAPTNIGMENSEEIVDETIETKEQIFNITGEDYKFSIKEIRVKEGDTVTINLTSTQGYHDWVVNEFTAGTDRVTEGNSTSVTFIADKKGEFEFYCSVGKHKEKGMFGTLIVE